MTTTTDPLSSQPHALSHRLSIEGDMTVARAAELKRALLALLGQQSAAELDLSGVREIDAAGLQLLLFAAQTARERNMELRLRSPSAAVREVFELLRLPHFADLPLVEAAADGEP